MYVYNTQPMIFFKSANYILIKILNYDTGSLLRTRAISLRAAHFPPKIIAIDKESRKEIAYQKVNNLDSSSS